MAHEDGVRVVEVGADQRAARDEGRQGRERGGATGVAAGCVATGDGGPRYPRCVTLDESPPVVAVKSLEAMIDSSLDTESGRPLQLVTVSRCSSPSCHPSTPLLFC